VRIAFVTQWFPPERGTVLPESIAAGLAARGHEVHVLTAFPNYPTGTVYAGWRQRPYSRETRADGVVLHRTPVYPSHDSRPVRRMVNYLSHALTATILATPRIPRPDVWLVYSSPATAALPAQLAFPGRRAPMCLLIQDLWPDSVTGSGMVDGTAARMIERVLRTYVNMSYRQAAMIGVISPGMADVLVQRRVPRSKIGFTPNWLEPAPSSCEASSNATTPARSSRRLFLYAGNLGAMQGLPELVDAFARVPEADLYLMGDGLEREALLTKATSIPNVTVLPSVDKDEIDARLAAADVLVVSLRDTPLLRVTMPSKVQASMRAGKPILAHAAGDVARLVAGQGAGIACSPGDVTEASEAIRRLAALPAEELAAMGDAARTTYDSHFRADLGVSRLEALLLAAQDPAQEG
jgi:colanic acid biosynthesis glycosyl transferase WcaI